jgi:hypothetical protein
MNKRLEKRHKRQVARRKERVRLSEPDVRTPEQIRAAREASHAIASPRGGPPPLYLAPPNRAVAGTIAETPDETAEKAE